MKKLSQILLGWWFWITNRNNYLCRVRLRMCTKCEFRKGMLCGECGCVLQAKARLFEERCPKDKWPDSTLYDSRFVGPIHEGEYKIK